MRCPLCGASVINQLIDLHNKQQIEHQGNYITSWDLSTSQREGYARGSLWDTTVAPDHFKPKIRNESERQVKTQLSNMSYNLQNTGPRTRFYMSMVSKTSPHS